MRNPRLTLVFLALVGSCAAPGDDVLEITYDVCEPTVIVPAADATPDELASIDAAIAMWNESSETRLTREDLPGAQRIPVRFEEAALAFYGVYEDEVGEVVINRLLTDPHHRAVTIAHELGHAFGLWHVDRQERVSVMNRANLEVEPTAADADALVATWGACGPLPLKH